jgi:phosphoenolpyruvate---glycerone phosphotransferase subunit DhaL
MVLDAVWARRWVRRAAVVLAEHRDDLVALDGVIGDGDHGENMRRGFAAAAAKLDVAREPRPVDGQPERVGDVLKVVATTLMSTVGGAVGPLYGTAFLRASEVTGVVALDASGVVAMIEAGLDGILVRGHASVGEKTLVDAWTPAASAAQEAATRGEAPGAVLAAAASAAEAGASATFPMVAIKGRASRLGERSVGHRDPGAVSSALILRAAADAAGA